jgi:hypothetical protein
MNAFQPPSRWAMTTTATTTAAAPMTSPGTIRRRGLTDSTPKSQSSATDGSSTGRTRNDAVRSRVKTVARRPPRPPERTAAAARARTTAAVEEKPRTEYNHGPGRKRTSRAAAVATDGGATRRPRIASGQSAATDAMAEISWRAVYGVPAIGRTR